MVATSLISFELRLQGRRLFRQHGVARMRQDDECELGAEVASERAPDVVARAVSAEKPREEE